MKLDKEKIFTLFSLIISIVLLFVSFYLTKIRSEAIFLKIDDNDRIINTIIKGVNYSFNMNIALNQNLDIDKLKSILKSFNINEKEIFNIYPRLEYNLLLKGEQLKNVYTFFEWEVPPSFFKDFNLGEPLKAFTLRTDSSVYPGAPRYYRHGIHRGFDFSDRIDGTIAQLNEPVKAVFPGTVVNIKKDYQAFSEKFKFEIYRKITNENSYTDDIYLDFFRGIQVYVSNGPFLFIYAHLNRINEELKIGDKIEKGDVIGYMGNTGVEYLGTRAHLHLEIYINGMVFGINRYRRSFDENFPLYKYIFNKF